MAKLYATTNPSISPRELHHMECARQIATEGMVLLENNGTLPLDHTINTIALYGNGARKTIKGGTGSGDVYTRTVTNVEQGLEHANYTIAAKTCLDTYDTIYETSCQNYMEAIHKMATKAGKPDFLIMFEHPFPDPDFPLITEENVKVSNTSTAIYILSRNSGEGSDRSNKEGDYQLTTREKENITFLSQHYAHTIVVLNVGGIIDTQFLTEQTPIDALLLMSQPGNIGGDALVDILTGKVTPSGKLSDTWAKHYEDYPSSKTFSHNNGNIDDEYYTDGIYVGYRYFDTFNVTPAYCFGYGRSYTTFSIETLDVTAKENKISVSLRVTNTGTLYSGKEVVQIYYSMEDGQIEKPYQELCAFTKTKLLAPQESQYINLSFDISLLSSYCVHKACWLLEAGTYYLRIGNSSRNTHIRYAFDVKQDTKLEQLKNLFPQDETFSELHKPAAKPYTYPQEAEEKASSIHITLDLSQLKCAYITYHTERKPFPKTTKTEPITIDDVRSGNATLEELISQLTVEEMADLCVGTSRFGVDQQSIIGGASTAVPGAAGDTTSKLIESRNIRNMIFADGPAGVRLNRHFTADKNGNIRCFDVKEDTESQDASIVDYYQYCTAIPIATHLAQTWNRDALKEAGAIAGAEMLEFGVTLWLAPGMNLHRNPLCGRNFEYYSEDPLLTGICAAFETLGVQSHPGVGTTVKHFAGNNQEDNRLFVNDHISERALRELYLKGFEICVKAAQPMSIMTSYNLINGIHTANSSDLLSFALRDEWGFAGMVMTDWGATGNLLSQEKPPKYPSSDMKKCILAGNDLTMPGSEEDFEDIIAGIQSGKISLGDLQFTTKNILNLLLKTNCYENASNYSLLFNLKDYLLDS